MFLKKIMSAFYIKILLSLQIILLMTNATCLFSDKNEQNCKLCSYDSFLNTTGKCAETFPNSTQRKVLILSFEYEILFDVSNFDYIYDSLIAAFTLENNILQTYFESNIVFYLSKGSHFILESDFIEKQNIFFKRIRSDIVIKPLFCNEFPSEYSCVGLHEKPKIFIKSLIFAFYVSGVFSFINIDVDANVSFPSYINSTSQLTVALFQIEPLFDDPNLLIPLLVILNCSFSNMYASYSQNIMISSFIQLSSFGGNLSLKNCLFANFSFEDGFFIYDSVSYIDPNINLIKELDTYFRFTLKNYSINFDNLIFDNSLSYFLNLNSRYFFLLDSTKTIDIHISNFKFLGFFANIDNIFFKLYNIQKELYFENLIFGNISHIQIININNVQLVIRNMSLENYEINDYGFYIEVSNFSLSNVSLKYSSN